MTNSRMMIEQLIDFNKILVKLKYED